MTSKLVEKVLWGFQSNPPPCVLVFVTGYYRTIPSIDDLACAEHAAEVGTIPSRITRAFHAKSQIKNTKHQFLKDFDNPRIARRLVNAIDFLL